MNKQSLIFLFICGKLKKLRFIYKLYNYNKDDIDRNYKFTLRKHCYQK